MGPIWAAARERDTCWQASRRDDNNGVTELVRWVSDAGGVLTPDEDCVLWKWGPLYNPLYAGHAVESGKKGTTAERLSYPVLVARGGTRPLPRVGQAANGGCLYTAISARVPLPMGGGGHGEPRSPGLQRGSAGRHGPGAQVSDLRLARGAHHPDMGEERRGISDTRAPGGHAAHHNGVRRRHSALQHAVAPSHKWIGPVLDGAGDELPAGRKPVPLRADGDPRPDAGSEPSAERPRQAHRHVLFPAWGSPQGYPHQGMRPVHHTGDPQAYHRPDGLEARHSKEARRRGALNARSHAGVRHTRRELRGPALPEAGRLPRAADDPVPTLRNLLRCAQAEAGRKGMIGLDIIGGTGSITRAWLRRGYGAILLDVSAHSALNVNDRRVQNVVLGWVRSRRVHMVFMAPPLRLLVPGSPCSAREPHAHCAAVAPLHHGLGRVEPRGPNSCQRRQHLLEVLRPSVEGVRQARNAGRA